jgi:hypothetical protein
MLVMMVVMVDWVSVMMVDWVSRVLRLFYLRWGLW